MHDPDTSDPARPICWFCGEPEMLEIGEVWSDSNFVFDTFPHIGRTALIRMHEAGQSGVNGRG